MGPALPSAAFLFSWSRGRILQVGNSLLDVFEHPHFDGSVQNSLDASVSSASIFLVRVAAFCGSSALVCKDSKELSFNTERKQAGFCFLS